MPVHRVPRTLIDQIITQLERSGETIVTAYTDGDDVVVITRPPSTIELRYSGGDA